MLIHQAFHSFEKRMMCTYNFRNFGCNYLKINHIQLIFSIMKSANKTHVYTSTLNDEIYLKAAGSEKKTADSTPTYSYVASETFCHFDKCHVDHSSRQFVCIHEHCYEHNGCFRNQQLDENIDYHVLCFHPEDRNLWCETIYRDILGFVESIALSEIGNYRFLFNHRYIRKDGSISQFLHEGALIQTESSGIPILKLNVFTELGDFKTDDNMILSIFMYSAEQGYQKIFTKSYGNADNYAISARELEIVKLCLQGLSSKMIAEKLNISIHTVKNHKRNCMEKTLTHNIAELINFCLVKHWL